MKTLVIAPHADDELLGCGGTLLKRMKEGNLTGWLLVTEISEDLGWSKNQVFNRSNEIETVRKGLNIKKDNFFSLNLPSTKVDTYPNYELINKISEVFNKFKPEEIFLPYPGDIHSDHRYIFECALSCTKSFRYPFIKRALCYETLSETEFGVDPRFNRFCPNFFIDITNFFEQKIDLLKQYSSELSVAPFPRSEEIIHSLAKLRGSQMGVKYAESFSLLFNYC